MQKILTNVQAISAAVGALSLLCLLGAEPDRVSESSLYKYEHFCDSGHAGWYILIALGTSAVAFIATTYLINRKNK